MEEQSTAPPAPRQAFASWRGQSDKSAKTTSRLQSLVVMLERIKSREDKIELELSDTGFRVLWFSVVGFHAVHALAYLYQCLEFLKTVTFEDWTVYLRRRFGHTEPFRGEVRQFVAYFSGVIALLHLFSTAQVLKASFVCRRLVFQSPKRPRKRVTPNGTEKQKKSILVSKQSTSEPSTRFHPRGIVKELLVVLASITAPSSPYFETLFNVRKIVEIVAQIFQVVHVFTRISAQWATNASVLVVILTCWLPPIIRFVWRSNKSVSRVLSLVSDIWMASFFTILVPFITYIMYLERLALFDDIRCWGDPTWIAETGNLLQLLLVNSWPPAFASFFTAVTMLLGLDIVKSIVKRKRITSSSLQSSGSTTSVVPTSQAEAARSGFKKQLTRSFDSQRIPSLDRINGSQRFLSFNSMPRLVKSLAKVLLVLIRRKIIDVTFVAVGLSVIVLHFRSMAVPQAIWATRRSNLLTCLLPRMPWFTDGYSCAVLKIQCDKTKGGSRSQIEDALSDVLPGSVQALIVTDCSQLEIPAAVKQLTQLVYLEISNSTLYDWPRDAALTKENHQYLSHILLLKMTNISSLPDAIASAPISTLIVHASDLAFMPRKVEWNNPMDVVLIERSALSNIPPLLLSTRARMLSLASNRIAQVAGEFLYPVGEQQRWSLLSLSKNAIISWPADNGKSFLATRLYFQDTNISELPRGWTPDYSRPLIHWVYMLSQDPSVWLYGSPLCDSSVNASLSLTAQQRQLMHCDARVIAQTPFDWLLDSPRPPISFTTLGGSTPFYKP